MESLENILFSDSGPGTREDYEATFGEQPLGTLIRRILGLELDAAKNAFGTFLAAHSLSADQITFINQIIEYLASNGTMEPDQLFRPPFHRQSFQWRCGGIPESCRRDRFYR